jgi:hypothetical protein
LKKVILERLDYSDHGTFGRLIVGDKVFFTGELPWRGNTPGESCVPLGHYYGVWTYSPRFKRHMYEIGPVDGRSGIRIHSANLMGDSKMGYRTQLHGCVALGEKLGWLDGQKAVLLSVTAIRHFETYMAGKPFDLEIRNGHP